MIHCPKFETELKNKFLTTDANGIQLVIINRLFVTSIKGEVTSRILCELLCQSKIVFK